MLGVFSISDDLTVILIDKIGPSMLQTRNTNLALRAWYKRIVLAHPKNALNAMPT